MSATTIHKRGAERSLAQVQHESINGCVYTDAQWERIEAEMPVDGLPVRADGNILELARYLMPNGSQFVTLIDASEETWEAHCALMVKAGRRGQGGAR